MKNKKALGKGPVINSPSRQDKAFGTPPPPLTRLLKNVCVPLQYGLNSKLPC